MDKIEVTQAIEWARKVASSKPPRYTDASRNAAKYILATRTDATPVAWHSPIGSLIEARQIAQQAYKDIEREKAINGHVPGNPYDVALAGLNSVLGCLAELVTHPPATDVAALVEALKWFLDGDRDVSGQALIYDGHWEEIATRIDSARQALAPFTKGQP